MYLTRAKANKKLPIPRKGTKYLAKASSHVKNGVPVVIAIRDMLRLARTSKEVKHLINEKKIKLNGQIVKSHRESIRLFNILEADKKYKLILLPTGKFKFEETKDNSKLCKVVNKKMLAGNKTQLNLHDGTNVLITKEEKVGVDDSLLIDFSHKIKKIIHFEKNKPVFIISGKSTGLNGTIKEVSKNHAIIKLDEIEKEVELHKSHVIVYESRNNN